MGCILNFWIYYATVTLVPSATVVPDTSISFGPTAVPNALIFACKSAALALISVIIEIVPAAGISYQIH